MTATKTYTVQELEAMTVEQLAEVAKSRGLTVKAADGSATPPDHNDFVNALKPSSPGANEPSTAARKIIVPEKLDKTIPGGRYITAQGKRVNAHGQAIDAQGHVTDGSQTPVQEPAR